MLKEQLKTKEFTNPQLASIKLLQRARQENGYVPDSTWKRVRDEEMSLPAEALKGFLNVTFDYQYKDGQLRAEDGQGYMEIHKNGLEYTEQQYFKDSRYAFALSRAINEYREAELAEQLASGQIDAKTIITISPYPQEAADKYGETFVRMLGAQPERKLGMLRAIEKTEDGVRVYTRGVEQSDLKIWNSILPEELVSKNTDELVGKPMFCDASALDILDELQDQHNVESGFKDNQKNKDVWKFLESQTDLQDHFFTELEAISLDNLSDEILLQKFNRLRYNFWSSLRLKFDAHKEGEQYLEGKSASEVFSSSGSTMQQNREAFSACGMSIIPIEQMNTQKMANEIFGGIMRCVTCPFCKKMVDAKVDKSRGTIECLANSCRAKVDSKGQRIDKGQKQNKEKTLTQLISEIFENLFVTDKPKSKKQSKK